MKCEICGNEHDGSYGSGRFCSNRCRHVFIGRQTKNHKCNFNVNRKNVSNRSPYGTWTCTKCGLIFETRAKLQEHNHQNHPVQKGSSWNKGLTKETDPRIAKYVQTCKDRNVYSQSQKGKSLSDDHKLKISVGMKRFFHEHPDRIPYLLNHSSQESYPESYFRKVFENEGFPSFTQDRYVNGYFLDFAFDDLKKYIEVDGEQHYVDPKIVEHDKLRYEILNKSEWKCVCRIRWSKFKKLDDNQKYKFILCLKRRLFD